ncbi:MAG: DUF362 domain-containing protein [Bryobacteraceae bacterium]
MEPRFSRRGFMNTAVGLGVAAQRSMGQQQTANDRRPVVAVVKGEERRKIVHDALLAIDDQIKPVLQQKKYVVLKPNNVSTVNQLAATHLDALRGILDYLAPRFKGPVVIAESSAGNTMEGFENFRYGQLAREFRSQHVTLTDLNEEAKYELVQVLDENLHIIPVRLAARLLDPDAFVLCPAILKTHNTVVATLSVKNMVLGAPLHQAPKETKRWNDKRKFHTGLRQTHYNMMVTAQKMAPFWGATVIDGYEGMEGNGPASGTPVPSRVAIASTDFIAADRVGVEAMGIDASWLAYLQYCSAAGIGQYDLAKIALRGEPLAGVRRSYRMHGDIERELRWRGPMTDIPEKIG